MSPPPPEIPAALWNLPALPPPPGKHSNFDHPENRNHEIIIINAVFLALMAAAVSMRFVMRRKGENRVGWDGLMCIIAVLGSIAHSVLEISSLDIGYGRHMWDIRAITLTRDKLLRMNQISTTYIIAVGFAKFSVLLLYLRFFHVVRTTRILIWIGIAFNILFSLAFLGVVIAQAVQCMGLKALSNKFCTSTPTATTVQAGINVLLDFYILFIPLQQVYNLNIDTKRKLGVMAVFGVGALACISSVVRFGWTIKNLHEKDSFWAAVTTSEYSIAEINIVIIAPCLVLMPAFIKRSKAGLSTLRTRLLSSQSGSKDSFKHIPSQERVGDPQSCGVNGPHKLPSVELEFLSTPSQLSTPQPERGAHHHV